MAILPGQLLGLHEILSCIGAGGMGEVYRAHDTRLDRIVAVKIQRCPMIKETEPRAAPAEFVVVPELDGGTEAPARVELDFRFFPALDNIHERTRRRCPVTGLAAFPVSANGEPG
jgi:serine/threonine protein kinase